MFTKGHKINKDRIPSETTRAKMSLSHKGWRGHWKGKKLSKIHKAKISKSASLIVGERHWNWKGGVTPIYERIKRSREYRLWRLAVLERDNYNCIWCGSIEKLEVDHIKPFSLFPELRFAIDNGRVLCKPCHMTTDTFGPRVRSYKR